jgi:hypothetical protein
MYCCRGSERVMPLISVSVLDEYGQLRPLAPGITAERAFDDVRRQSMDAQAKLEQWDDVMRAVSQPAATVIRDLVLAGVPVPLRAELWWHAR